MRLLACYALALATALSVPSMTNAHFLWVVTSPRERADKVSVYFSESASPDDPDLLDRVTKADVWAIGDGRSEPQTLELSKQEDALVTDVPEKYRSGPVALRQKYGVISRGGETFLLNYYAKTYPSALPGTWRALNDAERFPLEVTPELAGEKLRLTVTWNGKPLPKAEVSVEGPGLDETLETATNEDGFVDCPFKQSGLFSIRAKHVEAQSGEHDGKQFTQSRHYSTLSLHAAPAEVQTASVNWPKLPRGTTSFGGAIDGDWLYVYGGHYGQAHHYSRDGQSGDFQRLNLRNPQQWEQLSGGPKLTGLAMVAHNGELYRVGGFTANNNDDEEEKLQSQSEFARFDPKSGKWESLPELPDARSSHDIAVVGDTLYVVGGWDMQPGKENRWHDTAWSVDLSQKEISWKPVAQPPFRRRAVTLAAWEGKLYCIGGMQERGGPTTAVAVYDPAADKWSDAGRLLGTPMDGFGASAFAQGDALYVTTMSGSVQRLQGDAGEWKFVGQVQHPRFFHRMLPWKDNQLVIVGGAHMEVGKIQELEVIRIPSTAQASL